MKILLDIENQTGTQIPSESKIEEETLAVLTDNDLEGKFEIGLKIVSRDEIQKLNKEYRQKDNPTDVLSFPIYQDVISSAARNLNIPILLGDIIVCPEVIKENSEKYHTTFEKEFLKMISHSTLHLLGFHHEE